MVNLALRAERVKTRALAHPDFEIYKGKYFTGLRHTHTGVICGVNPVGESIGIKLWFPPTPNGLWDWLDTFSQDTLRVLRRKAVDVAMDAARDSVGLVDVRLYTADAIVIIAKSVQGAYGLIGAANRACYAWCYALFTLGRLREQGYLQLEGKD